MIFKKKDTNNQEQEMVEQKQKPLSPIAKFFNKIYIITTLIAYIYYVIYASITIAKNGIDYPISILLLVAVGLYTIILVTFGLLSKSVKDAKKRLRKPMKAFKFFKRTITVISTVVAIVAIVATFNNDSLDVWTWIVSIFSLIINLIKIYFTLIGMALSAGTSALKFGAKTTYKIAKKKYTNYVNANKKSAPTIEVDAENSNSNKED